MICVMAAYFMFVKRLQIAFILFSTYKNRTIMYSDIYVYWLYIPYASTMKNL